MNKLIIIVPCYNEQEVLLSSANELIGVLNELINKKKVSPESQILFVDDGSKDNGWDIIKNLNKNNKCISALRLAANVGHQNALLAGIEQIKDFCDMSITIDADLQDDTAAIEKMVDIFNRGEVDIVYGVRADRKSDSAFKRITAQGFYKFLSYLGVETVYNHADFRLMSSRAMKHLTLYKERNIFLRGIVPSIGFKSESVYYKRKKRKAGKSKYTFSKMLSLAWEGTTSFSIMPIKLIMKLGLLMVLLSIIAFAYVLISYFFGNTNAGWSSIMISVWFIGGLQLFAIGVIGQYIGKTYIETKERPRYTISEFLK